MGKDSNSYPKVLLLCNFNQRTANGITIKNLFNHWPKEKIAVADYMSTLDDMYSDSIENYYKIGDKEYRYIFPFNLLKTPSVSVSTYLRQQPQSNISKKGSTKKWFASILSPLLNIRYFVLNATGLTLISKKFTISEDFKFWVESFSPDFIYVTMGDISTMEFVYKLKKAFNKKLIIHVFDDFINGKHGYTFFKKYWAKLLDQSFRKLLEISDLNLVISQKMANEYKERYEKDFIAFNNPVIEEIWLNSSNNFQKKNNLDFTFVFFGSIIKHTAPSLRQFALTIESLRKKGANLRLKVYTPTSYKECYRLLGKVVDNCFFGFVPNDQMPDVVSEADSLLVTLSFNKKSIKYTRLSMGTKISECLIAKKPIFLFAPAGLAITEYLKENNSAYIVSSEEDLEIALVSYINNTATRNQISENAFKLAIDKHLSASISKKLFELILLAWR